MVSVPAATPVTTPPDTVAVVAELRQVPPDTVAVTVVVAPGHTLVAPDSVPGSVAGVMLNTWNVLPEAHALEML